MNNSIAQTQKNSNTTSLNLKNIFNKGLNKLVGKNEASTTTNSLAQNLGKTKAFSNRLGPNDQTTSKVQSKEASSSKSSIDNINTADSKETPTNGKEVGADLKVPGCSGGCGCNCSK